MAGDHDLVSIGISPATRVCASAKSCEITSRVPLLNPGCPSFCRTKLSHGSPRDLRNVSSKIDFDSRG
jgi:hypothetical protein